MLTANEIQIVLTSGGTVVTTDGDKVGTVTQVLLDDQSGNPKWVTVTTGLFGHAETYVPVAQASVRGDKLVVPYDRSTVDGAPRVADALGDLSETQEAELHRYYGLDERTSGDTTTTTADDGTTGASRTTTGTARSAPTRPGLTPAD